MMKTCGSKKTKTKQKKLTNRTNTKRKEDNSNLMTGSYQKQRQKS